MSFATGTTEEKRKLPANDAIIMMVKAVNENNTANFYKAVESYSNNFISGNNTRDQLKYLIKQRPMQMQRLDELSLDHRIKKLLITGSGDDTNVFLNEKLSAIIDDLLLEWENRESYTFHNIKVRNKILFHGATGNGKTTIAKYIAKKVQLPFVEVKSDEVIDSHLGSTGSNIHNIFNSLNQPCILFWDEVDSIGCKRGSASSSAAGHENDRMTNSILINLEKLNDDVIFIAATNRKDSLDSAFTRRFDCEFELDAPTQKEKELFADHLFQYYKLNGFNINLSSLQSYSEIKSHVLSLARAYLLNKLRASNK